MHIGIGNPLAAPVGAVTGCLAGLIGLGLVRFGFFNLLLQGFVLPAAIDFEPKLFGSLLQVTHLGFSKMKKPPVGDPC